MPKKTAKKSAKKTAKKVPRPTGSIVPKAGLSFEGVIDSVSRLHSEFLRQATKAVNVSLTLRNWLIGAYIHEYELRGADRAKYGKNPMPALADSLTQRGISGCASTNLYTHLRFYQYYPQIGATVSRLLGAISASPTHLLQMLVADGVMKDQIFQSPTGKLQVIDMEEVTDNRIFQTVSGKLQVNDVKEVIENQIDKKTLFSPYFSERNNLSNSNNDKKPTLFPYLSTGKIRE